jgi:hypothetical protein
MRRCQRCWQPYDEKRPRTQGEVERLYQTLFVAGDAARIDPAFCDSCYEITTGAAMPRNNESSLDIGGSNHGPSNMLLRHASK